MKPSLGLPAFLAAACIGLSGLTLTLTACSGTSDGSGGTGPGEPPILKAIPDQIQIDTQTLAPVSDQEASDGKTLFKALMVAHALQKQILIPDDESASEKSDREAGFNHLSEAQKSAVQSITS